MLVGSQPSLVLVITVEHHHQDDGNDHHTEDGYVDHMGEVMDQVMGLVFMVIILHHIIECVVLAGVEVPHGQE